MTVTAGYAKMSSFSIPSHQAMQAITIGGLDEKKPLQNAFKRCNTTYIYSNCIIYQLFYCSKLI